jgi:arginine transport system ATP-binding protein
MSIKLNGINCFYGAHQALFDITLDCPQGKRWCCSAQAVPVKARCCASSICWKCRVPVRWHIAGNHFDFTKAPSDKAIRELRQNVGMVFQQYNLWPHLTVQQNLIEAPAACSV